MKVMHRPKFLTLWFHFDQLKPRTNPKNQSAEKSIIFLWSLNASQVCHQCFLTRFSKFSFRSSIFKYYFKATGDKSRFLFSDVFGGLYATHEGANIQQSLAS